MRRTSRLSRALGAALATVMCASMLSASLLGTSSAGAVTAERKAPPGPFGSTLTLEDQASFSGGVDVAIDPSDNTAYVAWIGDNANDAVLRQVRLCVLPFKSTTCFGGIRTIDAIDAPTAAGIQVEVTAPGTATLVWFHQSGLTTGKLATATYAGGVLAPGVDVTDAPSFGLLFDVVPGPDGTLWALTRDAGTGQNLQLRPGLVGAAQTLTAPWMVGHASLAFAGSKPIVAFARAGQIADPVYYASGIPFGAIKAVPKTWVLGVFNDIVATKSGVRVISSEAQAGYRPVVGRWTGEAFSTPKLVGENKSCPALTFDLVSDGSGRLANVSERCGKLGIYNHPKTSTTALAYFNSGGTIAGAPQIGSTSRGYAVVAWGILSPTGTANKLSARWVRLPSLLTTKSAKEKGNKVSVKGPVSCLTPVSVKATVKAKAAPGWNVVSRSLKLDGDNEGVDVKIDGEKLTPGSTHVLLGKGVFRKGNQTVTVTKKLEFKAC